MFGMRNKTLAGLPLAPRRSLFVTLCGVVTRACIWALIIYALYAIVPRTLAALHGINPKLQMPEGPFARLIRFMCQPEKSIRLALLVLGAIDLPISYLVSNSIATRRMWARLMMLIPIGIGLVAGAGFIVLYMKLLSLQIQEIGV